MSRRRPLHGHAIGRKGNDESDPIYAVVDLETTGIVPGCHHRIAEIAVVHLDQAGRVLDEWCTLVNPMRDLGPQGLHGIRAADVRQAPDFAAIAGNVVSMLAGRVLVAHNLPFEVMHLRAEFKRLGVNLPLDAHLGLCTMRLANQFLPGAGRSLSDCCAHAGVQLDGWHSALSDARAAAGLIDHYLTMHAGTPPWYGLLTVNADTQWPSLPIQTVEPVVRGCSDRTESHFLERIVDRLPRASNPDADSYLALLDHALIDRHISMSETDQLIDTAYALGLHRTDVVELHRGYLDALASEAWLDGTVTEDERTDLQAVALLLGMAVEDANEALVRGAQGLAQSEPGREYFQLQPGDMVVFTGEMSAARNEWEDRARAAGLVPHRSVTKKVRLVVAADPDSLSGKARQARDYGIPLVTEDGFRALVSDLDESADPHTIRSDHLSVRQ